MKNENKQLGIYIHIPFCVKKCSYCDFVSGPADDNVKASYFDALKKEIIYNLRELAVRDKYIVKTIYFGGGTPSCVDAQYIYDLLALIKQNTIIDKQAEISIECNPGTLTEEKAKIYKNAGINRLSFGLQSANDAELRMLGRIHTFDQFKTSMNIARKAGFNNINVDIMSALPGQSISTYSHTLDEVLKLKPEHISAYSLIIEEGTKLSKHLSEYPPLPDEDTERRMYYLTRKLLCEHGYNHYEISNFAINGYECRHNLSYWERIPYIGFGTGAASLFDEQRYTNTSELEKYIKLCTSDNIYYEKEKLSLKNQIEEYMFLGLRKIQGINIDDFSYQFNRNIFDVYKEVIDRNIKAHTLKMNGRNLSLTFRGIDVSNVVMSEFLLD